MPITAPRRVPASVPWGGACPDTPGSALAEKHFLRSWTNELYLWFNEVADTNPANVSGTVIDYFNTLKTTALTATGKPKDQFHFTYDTAAYYALAQSGTSVGFGIVWAVINAAPPREVRVQEVQAGTAGRHRRHQARAICCSPSMASTWSTIRTQSGRRYASMRRCSAPQPDPLTPTRSATATIRVWCSPVR